MCKLYDQMKFTDNPFYDSMKFIDATIKIIICFKDAI